MRGTARSVRFCFEAGLLDPLNAALAASDGADPRSATLCVVVNPSVPQRNEPSSEQWGTQGSTKRWGARGTAAIAAVVLVFALIINWSPIVTLAGGGGPR